MRVFGTKLSRLFSSSILRLPSQHSGPFLQSRPGQSSVASSGAVDAPLLTSLLKNATSIYILESIIAVNESALNGVHDTVACATAGRILRRQRMKRSLEQTDLLPMAASSIVATRIAAWMARPRPGVGLGVREGTALLHTAATLSVRSPSTTLLAANLAKQCAELDGHQAANCLWSASKLSLPKEIGGKRLSKAFADRVAHFAGQDDVSQLSAEDVREAPRCAPLPRAAALPSPATSKHAPNPTQSWKSFSALGGLNLFLLAPATKLAIGRAAARGWTTFFNAGGEEARFYPEKSLGAGWRGDAVKCFVAAASLQLAEKELVGTFALAAERAVCGFKGEERIAAHLRLKMATQCIDAANALGLPTAAFEDVKRYFLP